MQGARSWPKTALLARIAYAIVYVTMRFSFAMQLVWAEIQFLGNARFLTDENIGLGDVIKRATSAVGVRPCGSCEQRAAALNRWLAFSGRRPK